MPITLDGTLGVGTPGITLAGGAITANANQLNSSAEDVNAENRIINGDFGIWQRNTTSTSTGYVAADRWRNDFAGGTVTQSRQAFTLGDTFGSTQPTFFLRQTVSGQTLPSSYAGTQHRIEGVRSYAGQTITLLGWARRSSGATGNMSVQGAQGFGTGGGGVSSDVFTPVTLVPLTGAWAPFAVTMNVQTILGKTLGTNGNDCFVVNFYTSLGSDYGTLGLQTIGVDLWGIHIRVGTWTAADAALYRPRDPGTELALCQRYYQLVGSFVGVGGAATVVSQTLALPVTMRAVPTASANGVLVITDGYISDFTQSAVSISLNSATTRSAYVTLGAFSGLTVGRLYYSRSTNSNSVVFDAEL